VDFLWPSKPEFSPTEYECPVCGHTATYEHTDLIYQLSGHAKAQWKTEPSRERMPIDDHQDHLSML
jgi:hypothetical protein